MASKPTRLRLDIAHSYLQRCPTEKRGFPTKAAALDVAESMMQDGLVRPGCHITPYACDTCGEWHVWNKQIVRVSGGHGV